MRKKRVWRLRIQRQAVPHNIRSTPNLEVPAGRTDPAAFLAALSPEAIYGYNHSLRQLRKRPLTRSELAYLDANCCDVSVHRHGQLLKDKKGAFYQLNIYPFQERLQLISANRAAYEFLASLDDRVRDCNGKLPKHDRRPPLITYLEFALDLILPDEGTLYTAFDVVKRCFVQRWNGKHETTEFGNGGMSTGRRWPGRYFTAYKSKPSPVTGEVHCLHLEYRICSARAVRALGVQSVGDLLTFDHKRFWEKNLVLIDVDIQRLGRYDLNKNGKSRRQKLGITDGRIGQMVWRAKGYDRSGSLCVQALIKNYEPGPFLKPIPIGHLLPSCSENELFN